jgi:hypothetical protein
MRASTTLPFLDRPIARWVALCCAAVSIALLLFIHRNDLFPGPEAASPADTAFLACVSERHGQIDEMLRDGVVSDSRATLFKTRAEALCRATVPVE